VRRIAFIAGLFLLIIGVLSFVEPVVGGMDIIDVLSIKPLELITAILGVILLVLAISSKHKR
jgi:hypothetical protein